MGQIGIYKIINKIDGKCYIGSSNNVKKRLYEHKRVLLKNKHHSILLQRAVNKHGIENFDFQLIEECDENMLIESEQKYFDEFKPEYNIAKTAGSQRGFHHSEETKEKLREARKNQVMRPCSEETKKKIGEANKDRIFSEDHRDKLSDAHKGKKLSDEHIENIRKTISSERMRENQKLTILKRKENNSFLISEKTKKAIKQANSKVVIGFDDKNREIYKFNSLIEARVFLQISETTLWRNIKNNKKINGLIWKIQKDSAPSTL